MMVSVVLPTYNESSTIVDVITEVREHLAKWELKHEVIVVDDDSPDGTADLVRQSFGDDHVRVIKRVGVSGLSSAVRRGFDAADGDVLVCMDADGQHPPGVVPELVSAVSQDADVAVGSRHVEGGGVAADWGLSRHVTSWGASALAWATLPAARSLRDPMSGCFAVDGSRTREILDDIDPHGYKILLEIIGKLDEPAVEEVGMEFRAREAGESNLDSSEMGRYAEHLAGLGLHQLGLGGVITPPVAVRAAEAGLVTAICMVVVFYSMLIAGALGFALTAAAGGAMTLMFARVWQTAETWRDTAHPAGHVDVQELGGEAGE